MAIAKVQSTSIASYQGDSATVVAGTTNGNQRTIVASAGSLLVARIAIYNTTASSGAHRIDGLTDSKGQTWTRRASVQNTSTSNRAWVYIYECLNVGAGSTTITLDCTLEDDNNFVSWDVAEFSGVATSSTHDQVATTQVAPSAATATVGPTSTLAQADELVVVIAAGKWYWQFNGSGAAPSTYTLDNITNDSTYIAMQTAHKIVSATTAVSATWTFPEDQSVNDGGAFALVTYKAATASSTLRVKGVFESSINSDSGITMLVWTGSPTATYATEYTGLTAESSGGIVYASPAPAGTSAGDSVNLIAWNSNDTSGLIAGVVEVTP
jgi:hypothetical protein